VLKKAYLLRLRAAQLTYYVGFQMALVVESGMVNALKSGQPSGTKPALTVREYFAAASGASTAATA